LALNIKNDQTEKLIHDLANRTGETLTAAITEAVRERLERLQNSGKNGLADRLLRIGQECATHLKEPYRSVDHGELLYDDQGLPR
jgi:antitoxin VapB